MSLQRTQQTLLLLVRQRIQALRLNAVYKYAEYWRVIANNAARAARPPDSLPRGRADWKRQRAWGISVCRTAIFKRIMSYSDTACSDNIIFTWENMSMDS